MQRFEKQQMDQAHGLRTGYRQKPVQVIAVTAGKGGVGKTNVSVNLAVSLSKANQRVMLLDADLGLANVDVLLSLHAKQNIADVMSGECDLQDIVIEGPSGIKVIPASSGTQTLSQLTHLDHAGLINAFNDFADDLDYLIIDTAAGISDTVTSFVRSAQEVVVVVCDEPTSITDAYALIKVLSKDYRVSKFHVLANMVQTAQEGRDLFAKLTRVADRFLNVSLDYMGYIPFDPYLRKSVKQQKSVTNAYPSSPSAREFKKIADTIVHWPANIDCSNQSTFFLERLISHNTIE